MKKKKILLKNIHNLATEIVLWNNRQTLTLIAGSKQYDECLNVYSRIVKNARQMPAYAEALSELIESYEGLAIEFVFQQQQVLQELPFEKLFVRLNDNYYGISLERCHLGKYEGKYFYLNLDKPVNPLNAFIKKEFKCI